MYRLILALVTAFSLSAWSSDTKLEAVTLLSAATATGAGTVHSVSRSIKSFFCRGVVSASTGASAIKIQVSNNNAEWVDMGTITLTLGTAATADGFVSDSSWKYYRANVSSISGTNATVTCSMGY